MTLGAGVPQVKGVRQAKVQQAKGVQPGNWYMSPHYLLLTAFLAAGT